MSCVVCRNGSPEDRLDELSFPEIKAPHYAEMCHMFAEETYFPGYFPGTPFAYALSPFYARRGMPYGPRAHLFEYEILEPRSQQLEASCHTTAQLDFHLVPGRGNQLGIHVVQRMKYHCFVKLTFVGR